MQTLRQEIIETQKTRSDLLKWKLIVIAGLGGAALGFSGGEAKSGQSNSHFALSVIPIACVYIDLLCRHLSLRILAIGQFIRRCNHKREVLKVYENYYASLDKQILPSFQFEDIALVGCTIFVSIVIVPIGIVTSGLRFRLGNVYWPPLLFLVSGTLGFFLSWLIEIQFRKKKHAFDQDFWNWNKMDSNEARGRA